MKKSLRLLSVLLVSVIVLTLISPMTLAANFSDTKNHWAKSYIDEGIKAGYISGYPDGAFRPNNSLTRGAFCKILNKALGLQAMASISFADVKSSDTFYTEIRKAVYAGYISGYSDNTFRANATITRQEAAVMLSRVLTEPSKQKNLNTMKDRSSIADFAKSGVQTVLSKGYITGDENSRFNPTQVLTRAQASKIVSTMLKGERVIKGEVKFTTSGKTYANNIYVGPVTSTVGSSGNLTFSNCKLLGMLTVKSSGVVNLKNAAVTALSIQSSGAANINASGTTAIKNTYLASGANLAENGLSGTGFNTVALNGSGLKGKAVTLRGAFPSVNVSSPAILKLASGSISALNVSGAAAGSTFDLGSSTNVAVATINGICNFTGTGAIASAVQNVSGVTYQTTPRSITGSYANTLTPTVTPSNGTTGVSTSTSIKLQFDDALLNSSGSTLKASNINNDVIELRSGSTNGTRVSYSASLSTNRTLITISPTSNLQNNTTYYVILQSGGLKDAYGTSNARQTFSFTTANNTLVPTVNPSDGTTYVSVSVRPTLTFNEDIYAATYSGWTSASYVLSSAFHLYKGSVSSRNSVSMTPSISGRVVTLTPSSTLSPNTTYIIELDSNYLKNSSGTVNTYQTFSFSTSYSGDLVPTTNPVNGATNVSVSVRPTLTFNEDIYAATYSGWTSASYVLSSAFHLYKNSVSSRNSVSMTPSISGRVVTLTPSSSLSPNTTYIIELDSNCLKNSSGTVNTYQTFSFSTSYSGDLVPAVNPVNGTTNVSVGVRPTLTFNDDIYAATYSGWTSASYVLSSAFHLYKGSVSSWNAVSMTPSISGRVVTLTPSTSLSPNTTYIIEISANYLKNSSGTVNTYQTYSFRTSNTSYPTVSISSGTSGVALNGALTLQFSEAIYQPSGYSVDANYATSYLRLYKSGSGTSVPFTVSSVGSSTITILPNSSLDSSSNYYISIPGSVFRNSAGLYAQTVNLSFATKASEGVTITSITTTVNSASITFKSSNAGSATVYFNNTSQPFTVSANGSYTATFSNLTPNTTYHTDVVFIPSGQSGSYPAASQDATTKAPSVTISMGSDNQTATITSDYRGTLSLECSNGATVTPAAATLTGAGSMPVTISGLYPGNSYTLTASLTYDGGRTASASQSFSVAALSQDTTLDSFWFQVSGSTPIIIPKPSTGGYQYESTVPVTEGTTITFGASASNGASVVLDNTQYTAVSGAASVVVTATVTAAAGNSTAYTITIPLSVTPPSAT